MSEDNEVYITKENEFYTGPEIGDISKYTDIPGENVQM